MIRFEMPDPWKGLPLLVQFAGWCRWRSCRSRFPGAWQAVARTVDGPVVAWRWAMFRLQVQQAWGRAARKVAQR